ncbi:MAG: group 1 glycosyl transferase [bacterium]|nr:MAG: group 1 glycosyl transferase [bacterium]
MERPANRASLKIAFFTDTWHPSHNGVVTSTDTFRQELMDLGHQVHIFAPAAPGLPAEPGVTRVASVPFPAEPNCRVALPFPRSLLVKFTRSRFDIIHTQTPFGLGLWGAALARVTRRPLVHTYHTFFAEYAHYLKVGEDFGRAFVVQYSRLYCNRCRAIVVPSPEFIDVLRSYRINSRIEVIPTGLRVPTNLESRDEARRRLGIAPETRQLLFVGRLALEKSIDAVLDAVVAIRREHPTARLALVGDGPYRHELEEQVARLKLGDIVTFVGGLPHEEVWRWYAASDLFLFASLPETQGLVVAEALSAGLPVVAMRGPGVRDVVTPANGGILTEPNPVDFRQAIQQLLADDNERRELSRLGREAALQWSSRYQAERLVELYRRLLRRPGRRRILRRAMATVATIGGRYRRRMAASA